MTVLSVVQSAAPVLGIPVPDVVLSGTDRDQVELSRMVKDVARDIFEEFDWQALQKKHTITGDGSSEEFALPSDYSRMVESARMWSSRWTWSLNKIASTDEWLEYEVTPYTFVNGNWIIFGDEFHFLPILGSSDTVKFFYMSNLWAASSGGSPKVTFTADDDVFRLSEDLLELGLIWRWRSQKGLPYEEEMADYEKRKSQLMKRDRGANSVLSGNRGGIPRGGKLAFPQTVGGS